jgi:hypothetical protein
MTDLEISKALALAIGWTENRIDENGCLDPDVSIFGHGGYPQHYGVPDEVKCWDGNDWVTFDYRDPLVIWPIAERYGVFPSECVTGDFVKHKRQGYPDIESWEVVYTDYKHSTLERAKYNHVRASTAAEAVALAVIRMLS